MYLGNTSHHHSGAARSYADAQRVLAARALTPTGKTRKPDAHGTYPLGLTKRGNTRVSENDDGTIAFRLYNTDVVTWHPDGAVAIENYGTVTTSGFASQFLPGGFHLHFPTCQRGESGGHSGISYRATDGTRRLAFGSAVLFRPDGSGWTPDADTIDPIKLPRVDTAAARAATRGLPWAAFENWLAMAPRHLDIEHDAFDLDACLDALKRHDFRRAAETLPLVTEPGGFGLDRVVRAAAYPITTRRNDQHVTSGSIRKLKLAIYDDAGALRVEAFPTVERDEFERGMKLLRQLDDVGVATHGWGPQ